MRCYLGPAFTVRKRGHSVQKWLFCFALLGVAILSSALTAAFLPRREVVVAAAAAARPEHPAAKRASLPKRVTASARVAVKTARRPRHAEPAATHITHGPTVTPSLYEHTTSPIILRGQGCRAGRALTSGLVVLDFGKLAYRPRRGGYGTLTF